MKAFPRFDGEMMTELRDPIQGDRMLGMTESDIRSSHPDIIKRLKRAEGHLRSITAMLDGGRPCLDIAQQLHAVEKAIQQAKRTLIHDHLDHCLGTANDGSTGPDRQVIDNLKALAKYL